MITHNLSIGPFCIHDSHKLIFSLYEAMHSDQQIEIVCVDEAPCLETIGLYRILDDFCIQNNFPKEHITVKTGNILETHSQYNIINDKEYWFEINSLKSNLESFEHIHGQNKITKHFCNFVGRSSWSRLWIASHLQLYHADRTIQTFHSGPQRNYYTKTEDGIYDEIGLEDLNNYDFNNWEKLGVFLQNCPLTLQDPPASAPLFYPDNLGIINYYPEIFVDIVTECYVDGNTFALTEKTWRAIACKKPFLLMSTFNSLDNLKKLGFKTFSAWWNEEYDDTSGADRVNMILNVIDEIATWPIEKCILILQEMQEILDHNYSVFCALTTDDLEKVQ